MSSMKVAGARRALRSTDRGDAPITPERVAAALDRARQLLGPSVVPALSAAERVSVEDLEANVDLALTELRGLVMSYTGPEALEVARAAYEIADLARLMRLRAMERRVSGLSAVQRALSELRAVGSVELMLKRCPQVVCERCGFDRAVLWRVEEDRAFPVGAFDRQVADWEAKIFAFAQANEAPILDHMLLEAEMLRSRAPAIVHDALNNPLTSKALVAASDVRSYVAAPIVPEGRVIGFLHADVRHQSREIDIVDRDVLWAFAEGCGYALERTLLREQVRGQRQKIREMLRSAGELVDSLGEAELQIEQADRSAAAKPTWALAAGGSRIHELLTRREIEVMEFLVHGQTNKQIAERLVVTEATVKSHVTHIFRKLRAANRAEAVHRYMRLLALDHQ